MLTETEEGRGRILIVDDQQEITSLLSDLLACEYDCSCAASGAEALEALRGGDFDLLLSDITMPGMTGLELIPRALEVSPRTVIVMISGLQTIESAIEAVRSGTFDYVTKPSALDARDRETSGHSRRVVAYSLRLGRELGLDAEQMRSLEFGSLLHDIGKIGVPDAILRKPRELDEPEWERMRQHPVYGARILEGVEFLRGAARVVAEHHERYDGAGYPLGLRGDEIDLNARIFAVADAFDAITSERVYSAARSYEE